jgi:formyl-CoA transferase
MRVACVGEINAVISEWTIRHTKHEAMKILGEAGVPCGAVLDTMELWSDPSLRARGIFATVEHAQRGSFVMPGWPVKMSECEVKVEASPLLGADNAGVYGEWLGLSSQDLDALKSAAVI